ncbi:hypothetical protein [Streptomyces sp. 891-h]|uniref:hypothetical protein n=1 Tax=Streptomyces sp. 891-h TaxID=2720714 RepID=UPI001FA95FC4|nr:hypothetical protein [Streptomyces sp. 891-h]UNZ21340.1 hypothetical protein HC362_34080 [Streptomyces sp. 891-h]
MNCEYPRTALRWLLNSASARLLANTAAASRQLTHADLDQLATAGRGTAQTIDYLRQVLVTFGVLPARDEYLVRIERHLGRVLTRWPEQAPLLRPYVRWSVMPRARRRSTHSPSTPGRAQWAYVRINAAADFLSFATERGLALMEVTQHQVDQWLAGGASTRYEVRDFLVWAARRGHSQDLLVPHRAKAEPVGLDEDSHWDLLQQCLYDEELPLDVRAAGALLLFLGQHLTRIVTLTDSDLISKNGRTALLLDRSPVHLPVPLATLLTELVEQSPEPGWSANSPMPWLFPGTQPGAHRSSASLARTLTAHGIPIRASRGTALIQLAQDMPPAVLAPLLGLHVITAEQWRRRAVTDWTAYLQARGRALAAPDSCRNPEPQSSGQLVV